MDVSVIIPARNEGRFLGPLLDSLVMATSGQSAAVEIIVVDNGSTDDTVELARGGGARVIVSDANTVARLRNLGAKEASGRVLAFVDADCTVQAGWLEAALRHFRSPNVAAVGSYPVSPEKGTNWLQRVWAFLVRRAPGPPAAVSWLPSANMFVATQHFHAVGGFDEAMVTCEDADLCYRLRGCGLILYDDDVAAIHYREPRTLGSFFRKEVWHGRGSFEGLQKGRLTLAEVPSLLAPLLTLLGILASIVGLVLGATRGTWTVAAAGAAFAAVAPILYTIRAMLTKGRLHWFPSVFLVYLTYFLARSVALLAWLGRLARGGGSG